MRIGHAGAGTDEVRTRQVAPTVVRALGLDPNSLDAVRIEGTRVLPDQGRRHRSSARRSSLQSTITMTSFGMH
jgi:hypothetical protein